jgi:glycosyltransferase involved in cell wall biosynthesis
MLVSVVIPTYNRCGYLKECLLSVISQSYKDLEIIVIDNCSTDNTVEIVRSINDPRIKLVVNDENIGPVKNYDNAIKLATGSWIHLFGDDDIMFADAIEKKVKMVENSSNMLIHSNVQLINQDGEIVSDESWAKDFVRNYNMGASFSQKEIFDKLFYEWNFITMPSVMFRVDLYDRIGPLYSKGIRFSADWDFWLRAILHTNFIYISEPTIFYRFHESNDSKSVTADTWINEADKIRNKLLKTYPSHKYLANISNNDLKLIKISNIKLLNGVLFGINSDTKVPSKYKLCLRAVIIFMKNTFYAIYMFVIRKRGNL